jgi:hypothetical protein
MEPIAMAITWTNFSAAMAAFVGVGVLMVSLSGSNHFGGNKHLARRYFWFTLIGAALYDVGTYLLQFHSTHSQPGGDEFFVATWGFTGMLAMLTGFNAIRPHRLKRLR